MKALGILILLGLSHGLYEHEKGWNEWS